MNCYNSTFCLFCPISLDMYTISLLKTVNTDYIFIILRERWLKYTEIKILSIVCRTSEGVSKMATTYFIIIIAVSISKGIKKEIIRIWHVYSLLDCRKTLKKYSFKVYTLHFLKKEIIVRLFVFWQNTCIPEPSYLQPNHTSDLISDHQKWS